MENKRKCNACLEEKELCEFGKDSSKKGGYDNKCKKCKVNKYPSIKIKEPLGVIFKCKACLENKDATLFYKNKAFKNGYNTRCIDCIKNNVYKTIEIKKETKKCNSCFLDKSLSYFSKNSGLESYRSQCNACKNKGIKVPKKEITISEYKICNECNLEKHVEEFHKTKKRDGSNTTAGFCKKCFNFKQNKQIECLKCKELKTKYCFEKGSTTCKKCNKVTKEKVKKEKDVILKFLQCVGCNITKPIKDFTKDKSSKLEAKSLCKDCSNVKRYEKSKKKEVFSANEKRCSKCSIIKPLTEYCRDRDKFRAECKDCKKEYNKRTKDLARESSRKRARKKSKTDSLYRLSNNVRGLIHQAIKKNKNIKRKNTQTIVGCTWEEFKNHIESQFESWMNWDNYGNVCGNYPEYNCSWDLDHIIPINYAKTEEEIYLLNHWSNFQPLCSKVNRWEKKGTLYPCCNIELNITVILEK